MKPQRGRQSQDVRRESPIVHPKKTEVAVQRMSSPSPEVCKLSRDTDRSLLSEEAGSHSLSHRQPGTSHGSSSCVGAVLGLSPPAA